MHPPWVAVFNCAFCGKPFPSSAQRWVPVEKGKRAYYVVCVGCVDDTKKQIAKQKRRSKK